VDALRHDDIGRARHTPPGERARQALDVMRTGMRLRLIALRQRFPNATEQEIEEMLRRWLARNG
jgi:hypothetical protein